METIGKLGPIRAQNTGSKSKVGYSAWFLVGNGGLGFRAWGLGLRDFLRAKALNPERT